jgi:hypothetical protein
MDRVRERRGSRQFLVFARVVRREFRPLNRKIGLFGVCL